MARRRLHDRIQRGPRPLALLVFFSTLLSVLAPGVGGRHNDLGQHDPSNPGLEAEDVLPTLPFRDPTLDQARSDVLERQRDAIALARAAIASRGGDPATVAPVFAARVFEDAADDGGRVGGIGAWQTLGGAWRVAPDLGANGSAAWTMTDPVTGRYGHVDAFLVTPALDLSAYLLQMQDAGLLTAPASTIPCARGTAVTGGSPAGGTVVTACQGAAIVERNAAFAAAREQLVLLLKHRYSFPVGADGGQVYVYTRDPSLPDARARLLTPLDGNGIYTPDVAALDGPGFTGARDWETAAFDLTRYAGRTVWIAFRVATSRPAEDDPQYFAPTNFPGGSPYGWTIDDLLVTAPAAATNLKLYAIEGPEFQPDPRDPVTLVASGANATFGLVVLNAAARAGLANATIEILGLDGGPRSWNFSKHLRPGDVWTPNVTVVAPTLAGTDLEVVGRVLNPAPDGRALSDPTPDNEKRRTFNVRDVRDLEVEVVTSASMVDYGTPVDARVTVTNRGNVAIDLGLAVTETVPANAGATASAASRGGRNAALPPGASSTYTTRVSTDARGEHVVRAVASTTFGSWAHEARYYVHASPSPIYHGRSTRDGALWTPEQGQYTPPEGDDWIWIARPADGVNAQGAAGSDKNVLRAIPTNETTTSSRGVRFYDLELELRYFAVSAAGTRIDLAYVRPAPYDVGVETGQRQVVWSYTLPLDNVPFMRVHSNHSWDSIVVPVEPPTEEGYVDLWSLKGLELDVEAVLPSETAPRLNQSSFAIADLKLTGIPEGGDPSMRTPLITITGEEPYLPQAPPGTVGPPLPSRCWWEQKGVPVVSALKVNCWRRLHAEALIKESRVTSWSTVSALGENVTVGGREALFQYENDTEHRPLDRIYSPVIRVKEAPNLTLSFEHAVQFPGIPYDILQPVTQKYSWDFIIFQVGFVEFQYRRDDGSWSRFYRLVPDGGYESVLEVAPDGTPRTTPSGTSLLHRDGFYHPVTCPETEGVDGTCIDGGYMRSFDRHPHLTLTWMQFERSPRESRATFSIEAGKQYFGRDAEAIDFSNRDIRLAFTASPNIPQGGPMKASWTLGDVRLTPVRTFAVDGAIENVTLDVPYDWHRLGLGPGTNVTLNVTVANAGLFPEDFSVRLDVAVLNGETIMTVPPRRVGTLAPGETRFVSIPWPVPEVDDRFYEIRAVIAPTDPAIPDDNPVQDARTLGDDGSVFAKRRLDLGTYGLAYPSLGRAELARLLDVTLFNRGNIPVAGATVERTVERLATSGRVLVETRSWTLTETLEADPEGIPLRALATQPPLRPDDGFLTPGDAGLYAMTILLKLPAGLVDDRPQDNEHKSFFKGSEALAFDDFEGPTAWSTNAPHVWGDGPGFRSPKGLAAANRTGGPLPADGDFWIESPPIPLSSAESAVVNFFTRYDFENGYDGGRVEVSVDGGASWLPVDPSIPGRDSASYPGEIIGVTALAESDDPTPVAAFTGSSSAAPGNLGGWIPVSINLGRIDALTHEAVFETLDAPAPVASEPIAGAGGTYSAPWMDVTEAGDPLPRRWSIENLTEGVAAREGTMWWSGFANAGSSGAEHGLQRIFDVNAANATDDLTLAWWDWRPGNTDTAWKGIGGRYEFSVEQKDDLENWIALAAERDVRSVATNGSWHRLTVDVAGFDPTRPLRVTFNYNAFEVSVGNLGWVIEDIRLAATRVENGTLALVAEFTGLDDEETGTWTTSWTRVERLTPRLAGWSVAEDEGPEGLPAPQWRLKPSANLDSRLVTPEVDLATVGGASADLVLKHKHNLNFVDPAAATPFGKSKWYGRHYQGAAVEIQMFNRTSGTWDPWRALFEDPTGPTRERIVRVGTGAGATGAPYDAVISDADDSFIGFPRRSYVTFVNPQNLAYDRGYDVDVAYVFTGDSKGFRTSRFDLTPFLGERVRFGFHAFSTPVDPQMSTRFWQLGSISLAARVLSTNDATLRFHLATDASVGEGGWEIDQFEVTGKTYRRSVGIHLDPIPATVPSTGLRVTGVLTNYGPEPRTMLAIGVRSIGPPLSGVDPLGETGRVIVPGYLGAAGEFELAPAGTPEASVPFEILVRPGPVGSTRDVVFELLEANGLVSRTFAPVEDDVPGRARARFPLVVADVASAAFASARTDPAWLARPGNVSAVGEVVNDGTLDVGPLEVVARWTSEGGAPIATTRTAIPRLKADERSSFKTSDVLIASGGNVTLEFKLLNGASTLATTVKTLRVARSDVALASGFEASFEGWRATGANLRVATDDAADGEGSVLFGYTNAEAGEGRALTGETATLASPTLDLRTFPAGSALTFWYKSLLSSGAVSVTCAGQTLVADGGATLLEIRPEWIFARMPLPDACRVQGATIAFSFAGAGQGWRLDGVQIESHALAIDPAPREGLLLDSARKAYAFAIENPGLAPRDLVASVDPRYARATPAQLAWMSVEPSQLSLGPGERAIVVLRVDAPAARGAFRQTLLPAIAVADAAAPFVPAIGRLGLVFDPAPRADLTAGVSLDGRPASGARIPLEEAIPHEVSVIVTNQGVVPSAATDVEMTLYDDVTGEAVWQRRDPVEALEPFSAFEASALATASWKPAYAARGNYTLRVEVDPDRTLVDYDRSNDAFDVPLAVVPLVRPDLAVEARNVTIATPDGLPLFEAVPGEILSVQGTVSNVGLAAAHDVTVRLLAGSAILKEEKIEVLPAGAAHTMRTNHFAGSETTTYRLLAFTRDLEIFSTNNEHAVDVPVFPPDVAIEPQPPHAIEPGERRTVLVNVTNAAPFPTILQLSLAGEAGFARLPGRDVPFGPGETRPVEVGFFADALERAGERRVVLVATTSEGKRTERSLLVNVAHRPGAAVVPYGARGPPTEVEVAFEVVNTGNVPIAPTAVVRLANGSVAGSHVLAPVLPGKSALAHVRAVLGADVPPSRENATLELDGAGGRLATAPVTLDLVSWGRLAARAKPTHATESTFAYDLALRFEGNAPSTRVPFLLGLPPGARATFDPPSLRVEPGATPTVRVAIETTNATPNGLYRMRALFLDADAPGADPDEALAEAAPVTMDLRRGRVAIRAVTRDPAGEVTSGATASYGIALVNAGDREVANVPVALYVDGVLVTRSVVDVDVVGESLARLVWKAAPGRHAIVVVVDPFGPHAGDTPAYAETIEVATALLDAEAAQRAVPAPALSALVALALALALHRRDRRRGD